MIVIGLTGGIGSGKSTVSDKLRARGAVIVDADAIVREVQQPGMPVLAALAHRFGAEMLTAGGERARARLASVVFEDPAALADLNAIVHPAVAGEIRARVAARRGSDDVVVLDVPLLVESARYPIAGMVVVDVPEEVAVERLVRWRGMDADDARARMARQASRAQRRAAADIVIDNSGPIDDLDRQIDAVWEWIAGLPPADPDDPAYADPSAPASPAAASPATASRGPAGAADPGVATVAGGDVHVASPAVADPSTNVRSGR